MEPETISNPEADEAGEQTVPASDAEPPAAAPDAEARVAAEAPIDAGATADATPAPAQAPLEPAPVPRDVAVPEPLPEPVPAPPPEPLPVPAPAPVFDPVAGPTAGAAIPGSYLPPSTVHRPAPASSAAAPQLPPSLPAAPATWGPSTPAAASGAWIPPAPGGAGPATGQPQGSVTGTAPAREPRPSVPGRASILADLPFDAPDQLEGWLVALGGGIAILGFFLPWTASLGTGIDGYFGSWGLGIVSHLPLFLFLVLITALAILPNRVATWVRTGVCGMVGGGVLFGIVWLYLGSDASQLGALLAAVGAVLLIAGGIIAVAPGRAARDDGDA